MIPKIIHYCWFGRKEKPKKIQKCIKTWREKCPDYQIIEWNEDNFEVDKLQYTKDAYKANKFAFVSDVARINALYNMGGIYLDTDVIVYKNFDEVLHHKCVLGFEQDNYVATSFMACEKNCKLMNDFYNIYTDIDFYDKSGNIIEGTNVSKLTSILLEKGLKRDNTYQILEDNIAIYPQEYFSPYDYGYCVRNNTENTICEHLFFVSWLSKSVLLKRLIKKVLVKFFGSEFVKKRRK